MQILHHGNGSFVLSDVEQPLQEVLTAIPAAAEPKGSHAAYERLYPKPAREEEAPGMSKEWAEYVQPELREIFESSTSTVEEDLDQFSEGGKIVIPEDHIDSWLNALNQARIALAARFEISEADIEHQISHTPNTERELALFQIHFYGFLQEFIIQGIEGEGARGEAES